MRFQQWRLPPTLALKKRRQTAQKASLSGGVQ
jgi:hypothetical protein